MSTQAPPLASMELLVHGRLSQAVIVPQHPGHPLELWVKPNPGIEMFSSLVGRQCGATVQDGHLWLFRPVPLTFQDQTGQSMSMTKMIALDGGPLEPSEVSLLRQGGMKVRYQGDPRAVLVITQGDVVDLAPVIAHWVNVQSSPVSVEAENEKA